MSVVARGAGYRLFMQGPKLVSPSEVGVPYPVVDAEGVPKYGRIRFADGTVGTADLDAWWRADDERDYTELAFSSKYIAFVDSPSPARFPVYTPLMLPRVISGCDYEYYGEDGASDFYSPTWNWLGGTPFAGWRSTAIPFTGEYLVYRDVSVLRLPDGRYVMFAVACWDPNQVNRDDPGSGCDLCITCHGGTPSTRLVYFLSASGDFREDLKGPFLALPAKHQPKTEAGEWVGVPTAFADPKGELLFLYLPGRVLVGGNAQPSPEWGFPGMYATTMAAFAEEAANVQVWNPWAGPVPTAGSELGPGPARKALHSFVQLGPISIEQAAISGRPILQVDEAFAWCRSGRLSLFFMNVVDQKGRAIVEARGGKALYSGGKPSVTGGDTLGTKLRSWLDAGAPGSFQDEAGLSEFLNFSVSCSPLKPTGPVDGDRVNDPSTFQADATTYVHARTVQLPGARALVTLSHPTDTLCSG